MVTAGRCLVRGRLKPKTRAIIETLQEGKEDIILINEKLR